MAKKETKNKRKDLEGIAFVGFFLLGMALGAFYGRWDIAPFVGLALGFIAMLVVKIKY